MERRQSGVTGLFLLSAAIALSALLAWFVWTITDERSGEAPERAVLVYGEAHAHG